jgi:putative tricarboxylic transport membrane protein
MGLTEQFALGFSICLQPHNLLVGLIGVTIGIIVGALPGLTATMAIAVLIPVTFSMDATPALILLGGAYCGALYGGSISAILLNTPGTPSAVATCIDGHPMAQQGKGGKGLATAGIASCVGGIFSALALILLAPPLARLALMFGPPEYFLLALLGVTIIISLSADSFIKGVISGFLGLFLATIGMDPITGYARFVFGERNLLSGLPLVPVLIGLLSTAQLFELAEESNTRILKTRTVSDSVMLTWPELKSIVGIMLRSSVIGTVVGAIPGAGANIASFIAYDTAKRSSKTPERYGTGIIEGIAAPESANNAVSGGAMITMLTLGIPGSNTTAVLMGGLMLHGLIPGPEFFSSGASVAYPFMMSLFPSNIFMLLIGLFCAKYFIHIVRCPNSILVVLIMMFSAVGSYAISNNIFNVYVMLAAGIVGYAMRKLQISVVPLVLAFILGQITELGIRRSIILSKGDLLHYFFSRPLSVILFAGFLLSLGVSIHKVYKAKKKVVKII